MLEASTPWWEVILRVTVIYFGLLVLMRLTGKRRIGQLTPMDFLATLLVSETVSPALTASDESLTAGLLAASTLFGLTSLIGAAKRYPAFERFVEGTPTVIVQDGLVRDRVMRSEGVTREDLEHTLRQKGVTSLDNVALAVVEENGEITIVERGKKPGAASMD